MKRLSALFLAITVLFAFTGCSFSSSSPTSDESQTETQKTADVILGEYISVNGELNSNGVYVLEGPADDNGEETLISWDPDMQNLNFAYSHYDSSTDYTNRILIAFEYGAQYQDVGHYLIDEDGEIFTSTGQISTADFSLKNGTIYSFETDDPYADDSSGMELWLALLFLSLDKTLDETTTGITLEDLGFVAWASTLNDLGLAD